MRVANLITKCTVFVGQTVRGKFKPLGTEEERMEAWKASRKESVDIPD
jgi:hypothetical protein